MPPLFLFQTQRFLRSRVEPSGRQDLAQMPPVHADVVEGAVA